MDKSSPQISDSPAESQYSPTQNQNNQRYSLASTDDFSSPHTLSLPYLDKPYAKSSFSEVRFQQAPPQRSILAFLEAKSEMRKKNQVLADKIPQAMAQPKQARISFSVINYSLCESDDGKEPKFAEYTIKGVDEKTSESWEFSSRYSMLREFYVSLKTEIPTLKDLHLPKFPTKKWFSNTDSSFLKRRCQKLSTFFQSLSQHEIIMNSKTMQEFISESRDAADEEFVL